jgi:hypothetical protein
VGRAIAKATKRASGRPRAESPVTLASSRPGLAFPRKRRCTSVASNSSRPARSTADARRSPTREPHSGPNSPVPQADVAPPSMQRAGPRHRPRVPASGDGESRTDARIVAVALATVTAARRRKHSGATTSPTQLAECSRFTVSAASLGPGRSSEEPRQRPGRRQKSKPVQIPAEEFSRRPPRTSRELVNRTG